MLDCKFMLLGTLFGIFQLHLISRAASVSSGLVSEEDRARLAVLSFVRSGRTNSERVEALILLANKVGKTDTEFLYSVVGINPARPPGLTM